MAGTAGPSAGTGKRRNPGVRKAVYFGKLTKKIKGKTETRDYVIYASEQAIEALNLTLATPEQQTRVSGDRNTDISGSRYGKHISVLDPVGKKTEGGAKSVTRYQIVVPSSANLKEIREFLKGTKAKNFKIIGGRSRSV
ncbi:hypothetical protein ACKFKG_26735 [Phormidesmis sp. 146-35]